MSYYNTKRIHSALKMNPVDYAATLILEYTGCPEKWELDIECALVVERSTISPMKGPERLNHLRMVATPLRFIFIYCNFFVIILKAQFDQLIVHQVETWNYLVPRQIAYVHQSINLTDGRVNAFA